MVDEILTEDAPEEEEVKIPDTDEDTAE